MVQIYYKVLGINGTDAEGVIYFTRPKSVEFRGSAARTVELQFTRNPGEIRVSLDDALPSKPREIRIGGQKAHRLRFAPE